MDSNPVKALIFSGLFAASYGAYLTAMIFVTFTSVVHGMKICPVQSTVHSSSNYRVLVFSLNYSSIHKEGNRFFLKRSKFCGQPRTVKNSSGAT